MVNEPIRCACDREGCKRTVTVWYYKRPPMTFLETLDGGHISHSVELSPATARALIAQLEPLATGETS